MAASANVLIRRSLNTADPGTIANGMLAYTANGDVLYIGSNGATVPIAGARTPGTLTANQALVANATSYLNVIKTANLFIQAVSVNVINTVANSTVLGAPSNSEITSTWAIKTYVDGKISGVSGSPGGANTQIQFNDSSSFLGTAGFTFDKATNIAFISNTLQVGANVNLTTVNLLVGNSTANLVANSILVKLANSTGIANLSPASLIIGTAQINATSFLTGANVFIDTVKLSVGNTVANIIANSIIFTVANSLGIANLTPTALVVGTTTANLTALSSGANVIINTTAYFIGNSTVNTVANSSEIITNGFDLTVDAAQFTHTIYGGI